jgi:molecular chaperone GrpE (heat shock protein)
MTEEHQHVENLEDYLADLTVKCRRLAADCRALRERCESEFGISDDEEALERRSRFVLIRS